MLQEARAAAPPTREKQEALPRPFLLHFLEASSAARDGDPTLAETPGQTSTDGRIDDDTVDDTDEDDPSIPHQTGLIADSNDKEDEDY